MVSNEQELAADIMSLVERLMSRIRDDLDSNDSSLFGQLQASDVQLPVDDQQRNATWS